MVNRAMMSGATFGIHNKNQNQNNMDKKDGRRISTKDMSVQNTLYDQMYDAKRSSAVGFDTDAKRSSAVGFDTRKNSHRTYGSVTEHAAISGGFAHEGGTSNRTRKTGRTKKAKVGVNASDFLGEHQGVRLDMSRLNYDDEMDRGGHDKISDELSVGFRPHPDGSDQESVIHIS